MGTAIIAQSPKGLFLVMTLTAKTPGDDLTLGTSGEELETSDDGKGELRLVEGAEPPDFENPDYPNRYIIAVEAGPDSYG